MDKEELIKFWKLTASGFGSRNSFKCSSTLQDMAFFPVWLVPLEKTDQALQENVIVDVFLGKEVVTEFRQSSSS